MLIEDIVAAENLDEILKVDHIDAFFVAPSDFGASMGHIGNHGHAEVQAKVDETLQRIIAAGRSAGTLAPTADVARFVALGVNLVMATVHPWLAAGAAEYKQTAQGAR